MSYLESSLPIFARPHASRLGWRRFSKRLLDVLGGALLLLATLPILGTAAVLIKLTSKGKVFYVRKRVGYGCRSFDMYKLRTMIDGADQHEKQMHAVQNDRVFFKPEDDQRITRLGRLLRKLSIDELPQVFNVLRGDMSLVGPRPLLEVDLERFPRQEQLRRFSVKPGLTGLWQVSGRSRLSDDRRLELDLEYVDRWSPILDCAILARTIPAVLSGRGAT